MDVVADPRLRPLRGWALANLVANAGIVVTGALVRLTHSGLGCPTWPKCSASYLPDEALGIHGIIEFSNRLLTFVLIGIALVTFLRARRLSGARRRRATRIALAIGIGIIAQGVVGGLSVLAHLNPWVVGLHLVLSLALILLCVWLIMLTRPGGYARPSGWGFDVGMATVAVSLVAMVLGTVVTGSGPNAGDDAARRNGLGLLFAARLHAFAVYALVLLTVVAAWALRRHRAGRALIALLVAEIAQGVVGEVQFFAGLPVWLVIVHMVGVGVVAGITGWVLFTLIDPMRGLATDQPRSAANTIGSSDAATNTSAR